MISVADQLRRDTAIATAMIALERVCAGGAQDLWDIRELLQLHDRTLESEVTADLSALPAELQHRWDSVRSA